MPGKFVCACCGFSVPFDSFGKRPTFCKSIILMEEAYVMKDPFGDRAGNQQPVILGSHCVACSRAVCVGQDCSLYYTKRFCLDCVQANINAFPGEIQQEIQKRQS